MKSHEFILKSHSYPIPRGSSPFLPAPAVAPPGDALTDALGPGSGDAAKLRRALTECAAPWTRWPDTRQRYVDYVEQYSRKISVHIDLSIFIYELSIYLYTCTYLFVCMIIYIYTRHVSICAYTDIYIYSCTVCKMYIYIYIYT